MSFVLTDRERSLLPSDEDVAFFEEQGYYASRPGVIPDALLDRARDGAERFYRGERDARLPVVDLIIAALAVVLVGALVLFVDRTVVGSRMRALADNEMLAVFSGMRVHVLAAIAWGMAGAAAAVAGIVYGQSASASLELPLVGLGAFPAAVLGGMDSITGIIPAAVLVAIIQTLAVYWFGALWGDIVVWSGMLAALLFVPRGLFGAKELKRL